MNTTTYFRDVVRPKRPYLTDDVLATVISSPDARHIQSDGRARLWKRVAGLNDRWVRVVLLNDGKTVHNAFLDRDGPPERPGATA